MIYYRTIDYENHTDRDGIIRMYRDVFDINAEEQYRFWYESDIYGKPIGVIAIDQENSRVIGHFAAVPISTSLKTESKNNWMSMGFMTDPEYRGRGIATRLYTELKKAVVDHGGGKQFIIGFPNENSLNMHLSRMEYREYRRFHFVVLPDNDENVTEFRSVDRFIAEETKREEASFNSINHDVEYLNHRYSDEKYEKYISENGNIYICTRFKDKVDILYWSDFYNEKELLCFASFIYKNNDINKVTTWNTLDYLNKYEKESREYHMCINCLDCNNEERSKILDPWVFFMGDCELF